MTDMMWCLALLGLGLVVFFWAVVPPRPKPPLPPPGHSWENNT